MEAFCLGNNNNNDHDNPQQPQQPHIVSYSNVTLDEGWTCRHERKRNFIKTFRPDTVEFMFHTLSPLVLQEARRQVGVVFGRDGAPPNLITVHIRWGDKYTEMPLVSIDKYVDAVSTLLKLRSNHTTDPANQDRVANIYLATEDPDAARAFRQAAPTHWNIYTDVAVEELAPFRPPSTRYNCASMAATNTRGRAGLLNVASLIVSMEANDFVLSTGSSFGRLMNALRTRVIDPQCGSCTRLIDVQPGGWA